MVEGYKNYDNPELRVSSHPTFIFEFDKYYYFFNLTSPNLKIRDIAKIKGKPLVFVSKGVWKDRVFYKEYPSNLFITVARVDKKLVTDDLNECYETETKITNNFKCKNKNEIMKSFLNCMIKIFNDFVVYNGNDNYECPDLIFPDNILPTEIYDCAEKILKK